MDPEPTRVTAALREGVIGGVDVHGTSRGVGEGELRTLVIPIVQQVFGAVIWHLSYHNKERKRVTEMTS